MFLKKTGTDFDTHDVLDIIPDETEIITLKSDMDPWSLVVTETNTYRYSVNPPQDGGAPRPKDFLQFETTNRLLGKQACDPGRRPILRVWQGAGELGRAPLLHQAPGAAGRLRQRHAGQQGGQEEDVAHQRQGETT